MIGPHFRDLRYVDLNRTHDGWKSLPAYPVPQGLTDRASGWKMRVHEGQQRVYLFNGRTKVDYFDLRREVWGQLSTKWPAHAGLPIWPYARPLDFSMELFDNKIYIMGGSHSRCQLGCNLFLVLDLSTLVWRRLAGYFGTPEHPLKPEWTCPGPRRNPITWLDTKQRKIFLMYGEADRFTAQLGGEPHGGYTSFVFNDFWSWDIEDEKWTRERLYGNPPSARSEMGCSYVSHVNDATSYFPAYIQALRMILESQTQQSDHVWWIQPNHSQYRPGK